ncbi:MAG: metallophosphatase [Bacteroidia bacterium]|nr:metallophosphatase [Bacteroidia bacterium]NNC84503.1 twin-arginine translocation signal domain-containing protein [Bacteroidia bacterium]
MHTDRRKFIRQVAIGGAALGMSAFPVDVFSRSNTTKISILHTNDVHSHIDPFPSNDAKYPNLGGAAQRAALIKKIRQETEHVLVLDAGDIFQGTPYFNLYGGELEFKLMSQMGYDAATIGNHDFDNGLDGLAKQLPHAKFPFISSNYNFDGTPMEGRTEPYKIFEKGNIRIGVFGLGIELRGLVDKRMYGVTQYQDPVPKAAYYAHYLKKEKKCDIVICLSHLGYRYESDKISDYKLAKNSRHIDLIIGGHTHTFIDKPYAFRNRVGEEVLVAQVGWAGIKLGRIDFYVDKKTRKKSAKGTHAKVSKNTIAK